MNIWLFSHILLSSIYFIVYANYDEAIKQYTYYFQTKRYQFEFDFDHPLHTDSTSNHDANIVISNKDTNNSDIHIQFEDITVDVLFFVNTSSYIFKINDEVALHYDYDPDWNEIETLILTAPSQHSHDQSAHTDHELLDILMNIEDLEEHSTEYTDEQDYLFEEVLDSELAMHMYNTADTNMTQNTAHRRRLYVRSQRRGRFIGVSHPRQFHDAERVCRHRFGGELASVRSSSENRQIKSLCNTIARGKSCWIGLRRPFRRWTDGQSVSYKRWAPGEPNNAGGRESCTELSSRSGKWNDNRCRRTRPFVCERARVSKSSRYVSVALALDWDNANDYCHRRFSTELATVRSSGDNGKVRSQCDRVADKGSCWIGLERPFKKWQDGSSVRYTHWQPGEPNNWGTGESCVEQYRSRRWNDLSCRSGRFFVCNYKGVDRISGSGRSSRSNRRSRTTRYIGCYKDTAKRALRYGPHDWKYDRARCSRTCSKYRYFALQAGSWCSCDNDLDHVKKYGKATNCPANRKGGGWANDVFENVPQRRTRPRRRRRRRSRCSRGSRRERRRCGRKNRRRRRQRWKCSRLKFDDYERKECLRRRRNMRRRYGRRRARRRWRDKLGRWMARMRGRGYGQTSGLGRGFRQGYKMGQQSVMGRRRGGYGGGRRMSGGYGGGRRMFGGSRGGYRGSRGYGGLGRVSSSRTFRRSLNPNSRIPPPPRIQLIDLPSSGGNRRRTLPTSRNYHGRLRPGQLGTGSGIGMSGHVSQQNKFQYPTHFIQAALAGGASMKDIAKDAYLTDIGLNQAKKDAEKKKVKEEEKEEEQKGKAFGGFKGFDGFGSGYYHTDKEKRAQKGSNTGGGSGGKRFDPAAVTFGLDKQSRRRLIFDDDEDVDVYDYDAMENERKCVLYTADRVYEICVGYDFVEIKKFMQRQEYIASDGRVPFDLTSMDEQFVQYVTYEHSKYKSMMQSTNNEKQVNVLSVDRNEQRDAHFVSVHEFVYDEQRSVEGQEEQCFTFLQPFEICFDLNAQQHMIVNIRNDEFMESAIAADFSNDADWNEVNEIIQDTLGTVIEKCVRLFEAKICVHCENDKKYKMLLYTTE